MSSSSNASTAGPTASGTASSRPSRCSSSTSWPPGTASYVDLTDVLRAHAMDRRAALRELFGRLVLNVLVGNTDDHARNHAAFVIDGDRLRLTPAFDICPQTRTGGVAA